MTKIYCACIECEHNKRNVCEAKTINLSAGNIATLFQGRKDIWECRMFNLSEKAKTFKTLMENTLKERGQK